MSGIKDKLFAHVEALFPICSSITGPGLRDALRYIAGQIPLKMHEVPSGTPVLGVGAD
jgi:aminopeptidase-like protein